MFWPYILLIARELQVWLTCTAYLPFISCNWLVVRCMYAYDSSHSVQHLSHIKLPWAYEAHHEGKWENYLWCYTAHPEIFIPLHSLIPTANPKECRTTKKASILDQYSHALQRNTNSVMQLKSNVHHNFQWPLITQYLIRTQSCAERCVSCTRFIFVADTRCHQNPVTARLFCTDR